MRWVLIGWMILGPGGLVAAQEPPAPIEVEARYDPAGFVPRRAAIELELSRLPAPDEGRIAVLVGGVDLTDLFRVAGTRLVYRPDILRLPSGQTELVVYLVEPENRWRELARHPLQVRHRGGLDTFTSTPRLDLAVDSELDVGGSDGTAALHPDLVNSQLDLRVATRRGTHGFDVGFNVVGVSEVERALRFGTEGEDAPEIDLSSYRMDYGRAEERRFSLGHVAFGSSRHLIQSFPSRGLSLSVPLGRFLEIGGAALHGTSIVGWDNLLGVEDSDHLILSGSLAFDLLAATAGDLRLELAYLDGSVRPLFGFNQGFLNDREESEGWSLRLLGATPGQRIRLDAGYSRSDFTNPGDPTLAQGDDLVPVRPEERSARFVDLDLDLVRGASVGERLLADVRLGVRHERVEPQYRTVASSPQADLERNGADLGASLGPLALAVTWSESEDNLDGIPSILTTRTEQRGANLSLPLGLLRQDPHPLVPTVSYSVSRVHQLARELPVDGGFSPAHLPDQVSLSHTGSLQWTGANWSVGYDLTASDQDNRQVGREDADFETVTHGGRFTWRPHPRLDLGFDLSREEGENFELDEVQTTDRWGVSFAWRILETLQWTGQYSHSEGELRPFFVLDESTILNTECAWRFDRSYGRDRSWNGQVFARYALQELSFVDPRFELFNEGDSWRLTGGLNLSFQ